LTQIPDHTSPENIKESAKGVLDQAKNTAGEAYDAVAEKAALTLKEQKSGISESLSSVADSVRRMGQELGRSDDKVGLASATARYTDTAARKLDDVANYFESTDLTNMMNDVKDFARNNPAVFLGGAFAAGVLLARFLKSSAERPLHDSGRTFEPGNTVTGRQGISDQSFGASAGGGSR
jgi:hypothetical protein